MEKIRLLTRDGALAAVVKIPDFKEYPEVVVWGDRVFQLQTVSKAGKLMSYNEFFCYVIPPTQVVMTTQGQTGEKRDD